MTRRQVTVHIDAEDFTCGDCCHRTVVSSDGPNPLQWPKPFVVCQLYNCLLEGERRVEECLDGEGGVST